MAERRPLTLVTGGISEIPTGDTVSVTLLGLLASQFAARGSTGAVAGKPISDDGLALVAAANYAAMRTALGLGTMATQNASAVAVTGGTIAGITSLTTSGSAVITGLLASDGATIGRHFEVIESGANTILELGRRDSPGTSSLALIDFHTGATSVDHDARIMAQLGNGVNAGGLLGFHAAQLRWNNVDFGTMFSQNAAGVAITGGSVTGITDITVADGGTGASDAATARTNLGLAIGTDVAAHKANLAAVTDAVLSGPNTFLAQASVGTFTAKPISNNALTFLGEANYAAMRTALGVAIGTDVQAQSANLNAVAAAPIAANTFLAQASIGLFTAKPISNNAITFLGEANYVAMRSTLGVNTRTCITKGAAATLTGGDILSGGLAQTGAAATVTLPTGTIMDSAAASPAVHTAFDFIVFNTSSGTLTIAAGTGFTISGTATIAAGANGRFIARKTAANTYVFHRQAL